MVLFGATSVVGTLVSVNDPSAPVIASATTGTAPAPAHASQDAPDENGGSIPDGSTGT